MNCRVAGVMSLDSCLNSWGVAAAGHKVKLPNHVDWWPAMNRDYSWRIAISREDKTTDMWHVRACINMLLFWSVWKMGQCLGHDPWRKCPERCYMNEEIISGGYLRNPYTTAIPLLRWWLWRNKSIDFTKNSNKSERVTNQFSRTKPWINCFKLAQASSIYVAQLIKVSVHT